MVPHINESVFCGTLKLVKLGRSCPCLPCLRYFIVLKWSFVMCTSEILNILSIYMDGKTILVWCCLMLFWLMQKIPWFFLPIWQQTHGPTQAKSKSKRDLSNGTADLPFSMTTKLTVSSVRSGHICRVNSLRTCGFMHAKSTSRCICTRHTYSLSYVYT